MSDNYAKKTHDWQVVVGRDYKREDEQKCVAEKHMYLLLENICKNAGIRLDDWDMNKKLLVAIISSKKVSSRASLEACEEYDSSYKLIKKLNVKLDSKYRWFTNIADHINHKQK